MTEMPKRLTANIVVLGNYGVIRPGSYQKIEFDNKCPVCRGSGLLFIRENSHCADGEWYYADNVYCQNGCQFQYKDLVNLKGYREIF